MIGGFRVTDLHVHIQPWEQLSPQARGAWSERREDIELIKRCMEDPDALVSQMDAWGIDRMALINYVAPDVMGFDDSVNEWVAAHCRAHPDRLIPVGSVNPHLVDGRKQAKYAVENLVGTLGIRMLKLHPAHQLVWPDAYRADSRGHQGHPPDDEPYGKALEGLYEGCIDAGVPLMIHTGTSVFPGAMNQSCDPLLVDTVATDYPALQIVMAHAGRPLWGEAAAFVAGRHDNVWLDISGIPPQRLLHNLSKLPRLAHKCLWGTDWPGPGLPVDAPRANVKVFIGADLHLDTSHKRMILDDNSRRLLP